MSDPIRFIKKTFDLCLNSWINNKGLLLVGDLSEYRLAKEYHLHDKEGTVVEYELNIKVRREQTE